MIKYLFLFLLVAQTAFAGGVMFMAGGVESGVDPGLLAELQCYQDNGEALDKGGVNVTATNIDHGTGYDSVANATVIIDSNSDVYSFPANETNGLLDPALGSISFYYKHTTDISFGHMFASDYSSNAFRLYRTDVNDEFTLSIDGDNVTLTPTTDVFDGSWYYIAVTWDQSLDTRKLYVGSSPLFVLSLEDSEVNTWTDIAIPSGNMDIGNRNGLFASDAEFQDFKIYDYVITP